MMNYLSYLRSVVSVFVIALLTQTIQAEVMPSDFRQQASDKVFEEQLRPAVFQDREIIEDAGQNVISVKAPIVAEDASLVPISIHTLIPQSQDRYIKKLHIYVDKNPLPQVGEFEFSPKTGKADLAMRIRVDDFSYVRAIAELNNGELYMAKSFVKAKGACSAPPPSDSLAESQKLLGQMQIKTVGDAKLGEPNLVQLKVRHPNITGMAPIKIGSRTRPPAFFMNNMEVDYNGEMVIKAKMTFSISMDPAFRFYFVPNENGVITVKGTDTKKNEFSDTYEFKAG